jgi:hypothetical protein
MGDRVAGGFGQSVQRWHDVIRHPDNGDRLELKPLHTVHGPDADGVLPGLRGQRECRDADGIERGGGLVPHPVGPRGDADEPG